MQIKLKDRELRVLKVTAGRRPVSTVARELVLEAIAARRMGKDLPPGVRFREGTVQEFCGLTDAEMAEIDARIARERAKRRKGAR